MKSSTNPTVTIITACYNDATHLAETIESVIGQTYPAIEYIVVDGGSTDGTLEILDSYEKSISICVSEPDEGVYDAMNKGIEKSSGDIIYFLNSGDYLYSNDVVEKVVDVFMHKDALAVYGNVEVFAEKDDRTSVRGGPISRNKLLYRRIWHQALFVRKTLFEEVGKFSTSLKLSADHEFIVKCMNAYPSRFVYIDEVIAKYRHGGMSCKMMEQTKLEDLKIIVSNYGPLHFLFGAAVCAYVVLKYKLPFISER